MKTTDELAASIRRGAMEAAEPDHSIKLHRLADEPGSIKWSVQATTSAQAETPGDYSAPQSTRR